MASICIIYIIFFGIFIHIMLPVGRKGDIHKIVSDMSNYNQKDGHNNDSEHLYAFYWRGR